MRNKSITLKIKYKGFLLNGKPISGIIKIFNKKRNYITKEEIKKLLNKKYNNEVDNYKTVINLEDITDYTK